MGPSLARLTIVSIACCQVSLSAAPFCWRSSTSAVKAEEASAIRSPSSPDDFRFWRKSRSLWAACSGGSLRAPCKVSRAAAATSPIELLISTHGSFECLDILRAGYSKSRAHYCSTTSLSKSPPPLELETLRTPPPLIGRHRRTSASRLSASPPIGPPSWPPEETRCGRRRQPSIPA
jgi:hypothetical protein